MVEELWRKLFETFATQSETQFREFQTLVREVRRDGAERHRPRDAPIHSR